MRTTLYEKVFIDGFHKPSYVVATLALERAPAERELAVASVRTLERHPRLRSLARTRFGVPVALAPRPAHEWLERGGLRVLATADVHALEEELLSAPLDIRSSMPLELYLVREPACLVVKVHHAVIDATSGFALLHDFARISAGLAPIDRTRPATSPWTRAREWVTRAQLRPRVPEVSVIASYHPAAMLDHEPITHTQRVIPGGHARITERARSLGATFSELVASALLSAMHQYNADRSPSPPAKLGLMFARARPRSRHSDASFSADTGVVSIPAARLGVPHDPATLRELRCATRDSRHNDLALAALYAARKLSGKSRAPREQRAVHITLSDLTAFGRTYGRDAARSASGQTESGFVVTDMRVLASPTSFDHAGMLVSRFADELRLSLIAHRGAVDADALLAATLTNLEES
jgi:hypothetical protein